MSFTHMNSCTTNFHCCRTVQEFVDKHLMNVDENMTFNNLWARLGRTFSTLTFWSILFTSLSESLEQKMESYKHDLKFFRKSTTLTLQQLMMSILVMQLWFLFSTSERRNCSSTSARAPFAGQMALTIVSLMSRCCQGH